jgi:hypothetical protein
MVAIDEIILESKPGGKSTGRRPLTSVSSSAGVYPVRAGMVQNIVDLAVSPVPISRAFKLLSGCRGGEIRCVSIIPRNAQIVTGGRCRFIRFRSAANSTLPH